MDAVGVPIGIKQKSAVHFGGVLRLSLAILESFIEVLAGCKGKGE